MLRRTFITVTGVSKGKMMFSHTIECVNYTEFILYHNQYVVPSDQVKAISYKTNFKISQIVNIMDLKHKFND